MNAHVPLAIADRLLAAEAERQAIPPVAPELPAGDLSAAYAVQAEITRRGLAAGRRLVGRKIGLTSKAVQQQLGVDQPDYGALFADMELPHKGELAAADLIQPRIEAEIAFVLDKDLPRPDTTMAELMRAIAFALPALEIVDSRIADWKIGILDTIADNGSSARFVLGTTPRLITDLDLESCGMVMTRNGNPVSVGSGAACLGNPLIAAAWLAGTMAAAGSPLLAGDVLLSGALGPMVAATGGETYEARISGFGPVGIRFR